MTQYFINSLFEPNHQSCIINIKESSLLTRDVWCGMPLGIFYFLEANKFGKAVYPFSLALFELTKCLWNWEKSFMSLFSHMFSLKVATTVPLSCFEKRCLNWLYPSWWFNKFGPILVLTHQPGAHFPDFPRLGCTLH